MGHVRSATLSRHLAPDFVMVAGLELIQLRKLGWLARCLYLELLAIADHATGRISTSYAVLAALLDFDSSPGAHATATPTLQRIRTALDELIGLRLVGVDRKANEKKKGLFLKVTSRGGISAAAQNSNRQRNRPARAERPAKSKTYTKRPAKEQQTEQQGVQEDLKPPNPPLSTGPPAHVLATLAALSQQMRGAVHPLTRAPEGA